MPTTLEGEFALAQLLIETHGDTGTILLEEFAKDFTPEAMARVAARTAGLVEGKGNAARFVAGASTWRDQRPPLA